MADEDLTKYDPHIKDLFEKMGKRIKQLRKQKGYNNHETFAYEHGFARAQFGRYERGANLQFSTIVKVVEALDMTLAEFFSEGF
jgi:transcriptional regulator with XRE-family HTH domain